MDVGVLPMSWNIKNLVGGFGMKSNNTMMNWILLPLETRLCWLDWFAYFWCHEELLTRVGGLYESVNKSNRHCSLIWLNTLQQVSVERGRIIKKKKKERVEMKKIKIKILGKLALGKIYSRIVTVKIWKFNWRLERTACRLWKKKMSMLALIWRESLKAGLHYVIDVIPIGMPLA